MKIVVRRDDAALAVLKSLKKGPVSGEEIATKLGVSRTAVWKAVEKLKKAGYVIDARKRVGYVLVSSPEFSAYEVADVCFANGILEVHHYSSIDSTNEKAKEKQGIVVIADRQTAGRGRRGRRWYSEEGGLYFSISLPPHLNMEDLPKLTLTTGVAVCEALSFANAKLKWPNDVLVGGKKVCGVLCEVVGEAESPAVVVGIGINVTNPIPDELKDIATNLLEFGVGRKEIFEKVVGNFFRLYRKLPSDWEEIRQRWKELSDTLGRIVEIRVAERLYRGIAVDIDESGALILDSNGKVERIFSGECFYLQR
ncbi:biotin--[acetyl-CoA-carboxylase] ligase [Archaeoglobus veneficus]|uniref:Biotin/acetyl-CoA-carboxylase ligase n=1 Tax=Archaeoglobus veneficus (strain DSM 11195 / SNP6) TaxID=693661 RepID=F2KQI5_ARCVS|nr:biotin--[acetyl-CoA-carboxylase] ligase [Archaeoglobus veneficus]AEA47718.1 biotin/acetyl-CoA-carboxylase ligase [Archaeoglobus veneficus SNP6]